VPSSMTAATVSANSCGMRIISETNASEES
jgi:hypothetical protein